MFGEDRPERGQGRFQLVDVVLEVTSAVLRLVGRTRGRLDSPRRLPLGCLRGGQVDWLQTVYRDDVRLGEHRAGGREPVPRRSQGGLDLRDSLRRAHRFQRVGNRGEPCIGGGGEGAAPGVVRSGLERGGPIADVEQLRRTRREIVEPIPPSRNARVVSCRGDEPGTQLGHLGLGGLDPHAERGMIGVERPGLFLQSGSARTQVVHRGGRLRESGGHRAGLLDLGQRGGVDPAQLVSVAPLRALGQPVDVPLGLRQTFRLAFEHRRGPLFGVPGSLLVVLGDRRAARERRHGVLHRAAHHALLAVDELPRQLRGHARDALLTQVQQPSARILVRGARPRHRAASGVQCLCRRDEFLGGGSGVRSTYGGLLRSGQDAVRLLGPAQRLLRRGQLLR